MTKIFKIKTSYSKRTREFDRLLLHVKVFMNNYFAFSRTEAVFREVILLYGSASSKRAGVRLAVPFSNPFHFKNGSFLPDGAPRFSVFSGRVQFYLACVQVFVLVGCY